MSFRHVCLNGEEFHICHVAFVLIHEIVGIRSQDDDDDDRLKNDMF